MSLFDSISDEMRWRKIEQFMEQTKAEIIQLLKRAPQRQHEYMGHLPHAADAFAGVTGGGGPSAGSDLRQGFLATDLEAPEEALGPATSATVWHFIRDPADDTLFFVGSFEALNWDMSLSGVEGTYCKCEFLDGVWSFYWMACEPTLEMLTDQDEEPLQDEDGDFFWMDP